MPTELCTLYLYLTSGAAAYTLALLQLCCVAGWCISWTPAPKFYAYCTSKRAASQEPQPGMTDNSPAPSGPKAAAPGPQPEAPNTSSPAAKPKVSAAGVRAKGITSYTPCCHAAVHLADRPV
jgi:hypothetical protein